MRTFTIELPMPPSTNRIWSYGKRNVFKSKAYLSWQRTADGHLYMAKRRPVALQDFATKIVVDNQHWGQIDIDNLVKALLDWCQRCALIANDKWCRDLHMCWGDAPTGILLTLTEWPDEKDVSVLRTGDA